VQEIIEQSASEILKIYLYSQQQQQQGNSGSSDDAQRSPRKWTPTQAWLLIRLLASTDTLRYNEVLLAIDALKSPNPTPPDAVLQALEQAELITIVAAPNGRPSAVKPGKPVFAPAFRLLRADRVLGARLDALLLAEQVKAETAAIRAAEEELRLLGELGRRSWSGELGARVEYLLKKLQASQAKIERFEREAGVAKGVLTTEY